MPYLIPPPPRRGGSGGGGWAQGGRWSGEGPRSEIVGSYGGFIPSFLRNLLLASIVAV